MTLGPVQTGSVVQTLRYDGLGRRIVQEVKNSADLDCTYHFYYDEQSVIEIRDGSGLVLQQCLWVNPLGGYVDELAQVAVNGNPFDDPGFDPDDPDHDFRGCFALHDASYNVRALVDESGAVVERYEYTPYGERTVYTSPGTNDPLAMSPALLSQRVEVAGIAQPYGINAVGHQGLLHEEAAGLVHNRARMLHPRMGRFMQRDPMDQNISGGGYQDGMNAYAAYHILDGGYDPGGLERIRVGYRGLGPANTAGETWHEWLIGFAVGSEMYNWSQGAQSIRMILGKIDTNGNKVIEESEVQDLDLGLHGFSQGAVGAIDVSKRLNTRDGKKLEGYTMCVSVPVKILVTIDPASFVFIIPSPRGNVEKAVNYYQRGAGYSVLYRLDSSGNVIGTEKIGTPLSIAIRGNSFRGATNYLVDVAGYREGLILAFWGDFNRYRLYAKDVNHDTIPWYVAPWAVADLR